MRRLLMAALIALPTVAQANFYTGNDLHQRMQDRDLNMLTLGYVGGVFDATVMFAHCPPPSVTMGQARDMVQAWLANNPQYRHRRAAELVLHVFMESWPCPKG